LVRCRDRIKGVASSSHAATIKRDNFPPSYPQFSAATAYHEWVFQYEPTPNPAQPGQPAPPQLVC
ncbi:MAG: type II secretion system protein, partial [Nitrospiria bacterium]